jgi:hypothetical protein
MVSTVSEEKLFLCWATKNKNWTWEPCLFSNGEEIKTQIDAFCQVSITSKPVWLISPLLVALIDWLFGVYVPLKNFSLLWRRHHYRWRAAKFRPMLSAQGIWAGMDLYRATPAVTQDLGFSGLIRRTAPFRRLLRHTRGCGGSIPTWILTGSLLVTCMTMMTRKC